MDQNNDLRRILLQQLEGLRGAGVQTLPKGSGKHVFLLPDAKLDSEELETPIPAKNQSNLVASSADTLLEPSNSAAAPARSSSAGYAESLPREERKAALEVIEAEVAQCSKCPELCTSRKQTVFGVGNPSPRLCFVGEGPGADEDRMGEPFVGAAGQLLNKIIVASKMSREDVYILNTVKCRPPGNRNPTESELENCWPYAIRQLEILQPEFICCLGSVAARTVLQTKSSISKLRGQFHAFRGSRVVVTYHPAYLLRTPTAKKHTWNDMKMLMAEMGIDV